MTTPQVLKVGLVGYLYRWLRNAGVIALVSGAAVLAFTVDRTAGDQRAMATVSRTEIVCEIVEESLLNTGAVHEVECSQAAAIVEHNSHMAIASREAVFLHLSYQTATGENRSARVRADEFTEDVLSRGDELEIAYRDNTSEVRPPVVSGSLMRALWLMLGGVLALMLVFAVRRAANFESSVDDEIEDMRRAHDNRAVRRQRAVT